MVWPLIRLRDRRGQARDDIAHHLPGADATVPNSILRALAEMMAALTHDNDRHLYWVARMMMPDTAEGPFAQRWGDLWLEDGRKPAALASGAVTVAGTVGAGVPTGAVLTATAYDAAGAPIALEYEVVAGVTLATTTAVVAVAALTPGAAGNLAEGAQLAWRDVPDGVDGRATVAAPGFAGGADIETDADLIARYIDRIQEPPHGGNAHDYVQWLEAIPGIAPGRAWCSPLEMGVGTVTLRFMLDDTRPGGLPLPADLALVQGLIDARRPVTVAQVYVVAPIAQPLDLVIDDLAGDAPEVRAAIETEVRAMLRARARPGGIVYASWVREAVSAATGEDHHDLTVANQIPASAGHMIVLGTITYV